MLAPNNNLPYKCVMKRDTLKTIAGLVIIVLIVSVTYFYGNSQRQADLRRQAEAKRTQQEASNKNAKDQAAANQAQQKATATPPVSTATPTASNHAAAQQPAATTIPDTGSADGALIPIAILGAMGVWYYRSRRAVTVAVSTRS